MDFTGFAFLLGRSVHYLRATRSTERLLNLRQKTFRLEVRRNFFSNRVIDSWNKIPNAVKNVESVFAFKRGYKNHRAAMVTPT
jgi:hypothetical protein